MNEYKILMVKMEVEMPAPVGQKGNASAPTSNFDALVDIEVMLSLAYFVPMLNTVHCLIKLTQPRDMFVCDFMQAIKVCQNELLKTVHGTIQCLQNRGVCLVQ